MKQHLLTLLLAAMCIPATAQEDEPEQQKMRRHHVGLDVVYIHQISTGTNGATKTYNTRRLGGDISYRFCILPMLRVGAFYENTTPNNSIAYSIPDIYGFTLDFPIWIENRVAIAPGIISNIRMPSKGNTNTNLGSPITGGVYVNVMALITKSLALSIEAGSRKMPVYGYRQYPIRVGMKILL